MPSIRGVIKRRLLVNFRVDPAAIQRILPAGLSPKLQGDHAIAGICLIRLEQIRPSLIPWSVGFSGENAAHRVAVTWRDAAGTEKEGVYIPMRHTNSSLILLVGGRVFPGVHQRATFDVADSGTDIDISIRAAAGDMEVALRGRSAEQLPSASAFRSLAAASEFFRGGSVGYSPGRDRGRLEGLKLVSPKWRVDPLTISEVHSSWLSDTSRFPAGSTEFDCALVMRDIAHYWVIAPDLYVDPEGRQAERTAPTSAAS
jgi:Uncharacterized conserved protein (COG2071)